MRTADFLKVVLAAVLWGGGGVVGVALSRHSDIPPMSVAMWRMLVGGLSLVLFLWWRGGLRPGTLHAQAWRRIILTGALTAAFEALYFGALSLSSVGLATLIGIGSAPLFSVILGWVFRGERPSRAATLALGLAFAGLSLLLAGSFDLGSNGLWGGVLAVGNGATFAALTAVNRTAVVGLGPIPLTAYSFTLGGVLLVPVAAVGGLAAASDATGWGLIVVLGVAITAVAYVAYLGGLSTVPPFVATMVALLEPLVAALLGAILLAERIGLWGIVGAACLGAAVLLLRPRGEQPQVATT